MIRGQSFGLLSCAKRSSHDACPVTTHAGFKPQSFHGTASELACDYSQRLVLGCLECVDVLV